MKAESKYDAKIIKYLDQKRGRSYQLGPELVTTLDLTAAGWSTLGGVSARTTNTLTTTSAGGLTNTTIMSGNKMYLVQLGFSKTGSSSLSVRLYSGGPDVVLSASSTGVISGVGNTIASDEFYLRLSGADIVTVTSLSVREVIIQ
jgi:hypothetical protein